MNLFSKEKDFVLRIANLILFCWLLTSVILSMVNTINLLTRDKLMPYNDFKNLGCTSSRGYYNYAYDSTISKCIDINGNTYPNGQIEEEICKKNYVYEKENYKQSERNMIRNIYISLSNVIIVLGAMIFLNIKRK